MYDFQHRSLPFCLWSWSGLLWPIVDFYFSFQPNPDKDYKAASDTLSDYIAEYKRGTVRQEGFQRSKFETLWGLATIVELCGKPVSPKSTLISYWEGTVSKHLQAHNFDSFNPLYELYTSLNELTRYNYAQTCYAFATELTTQANLCVLGRKVLETRARTGIVEEYTAKDLYWIPVALGLLMKDPSVSHYYWDQPWFPWASTALKRHKELWDISKEVEKTYQERHNQSLSFKKWVNFWQLPSEEFLQKYSTKNRKAVYCE